MNGGTPSTDVYSTGAVAPGTAYFDSLQYDEIQNLLGDALGYNFKYVISADDFRFLGGNTYRIQIVSNVGGSDHVQVYNVKVGEVL